MIAQVQTSRLSISYHEYGPPDGVPAVLMHGFPYSPRAFDAVAPLLASSGLRVIVPYLRGFGPTRFLNSVTLRSGEQAALGQDLIDLVEALGLDRPVVAGYDWGGRAACVTAAVRPDLVRGLVTCGGYNIFGPAVTAPLSPEFEHVLWYQYYLHMHRGQLMLENNRRGFCRLLWKLWSPSWAFCDTTFEESAVSFDNSDFVDVVLHSYRHRSGLVPGDPEQSALATRLEQERPVIHVPTITLFGEDDMMPPALARDIRRFASFRDFRSAPGIGHNLPQEAPGLMAQAVLDLAKD